MFKRLTKLMLAASALLCAVPAGAEVIYTLNSQEDFNACSTLQLNSSQSNNWKWYSYSGYITIEFYSGTSDAYLTTPEISLEAGKVYQANLTVSGRMPSNMTDPGNLTILRGQGDDPTAYTAEIMNLQSLSYTLNADAAQKESVFFGVEQSGNYRLTFHSTSMVWIFGFDIEEMGSADSPAAVSDFTVLPVGSTNSVNVSFTVPENNVIGQPVGVGTLRAEVKRGETVVHNQSYAPGASVNFTDDNAPSGDVEYTVVIYNGDNASVVAKANCWVGAQAPLPVTNIGITPVAGGFNVTWTAPTVGAQGGVLNPNELTYDIVRYVNGVESATFNNVSEMPYFDAYVPSSIEQLSYSIKVKNGEVEGEAVSSDAIRVGAFNLPIVESFANKVMGEYWSTQVISGTSYNWEMTASVPHVYATPQDDDGGCIYYNCYSSYSGNQARLISPPISTASSTNPYVEFYFYHYTTGSQADKVVVEVSKDGGDWEELPDASVERTAGSNGWAEYSFPLLAAIEGSQTYQVAFKAVSAYGYEVALDNIRIRNKAEFDLEISALEGPATIIAGNEGEYTFKVKNLGAAKVEATDYTIDVNATGIDVEDIATIALEAGETAEFSFTVPFTAAEASEAPYNFNVSVAYAQDQLPENNTASIATTVTTSIKPGASDLESEYDKEAGIITLTWTPAVDMENYTPMEEVVESFEGLPVNTTGTFNTFTSRSLAGEAGSSWYGWNCPEFTVVDRSLSTYSPTPTDGSQYAIVTTKGGDKWLVSPELECFAAGTMNLSFSAYYQSQSSQSWTVSVLYSTTDDNTDSFTNVIDEKTITAGETNSWKMYSYSDIPANAKYIALRFVSLYSGSNGVYVDNIRISEQFEPVLGYHVYEEGKGRLTEEMLEPTVNSYTIQALGSMREAGVTTKSRSFFVTAVYNEGETAMSNIVTVNDIPTIVDSSFVSNMEVYTEGEALVVLNADENTMVYSLDGRIVARCHAGNNRILLPSGIYIVKGANTVKVIM